MRQYSKVLKSIRKLPPEFYNQLDQNAQCLSLKMGDTIKKVGQECDCLLFIEKGVVRGYMQEYAETYWFKKENEFIFLLLQIGNQKIDNQMGIEMLEDGIVWEFTGGFITRIEKEFLGINYHLMHLLVKEIMRNQELTSLERRGDPAHFYDYLRQESPDLFTRVSHAHLASFIGVSEKEFAHMHKSNLHIPMSFTRRGPKKSK
jgi:CRP-like cAMP-binding protein